MAEDHRALGLGHGDGRVDGAVVDDEDVEVGGVAVDVADDAADHPLLVVGGNDGQQAQLLAVFGRHRDRSSGAAERLRRAIKGTARHRRIPPGGLASAQRCHPRRDPRRGLDRLEREITGCRACPRLVAWREAVAADPPKRFRGQDYWARPVPGFGDRDAPIVLSGSRRPPTAPTGPAGCSPATAPATGCTRRCSAPVSRTSRSRSSATTGSSSTGAYVTAAVRCAPPANKPTTAERDRCRPFLDRELALLANVRVIVALGSFGWDAALRGLARAAAGRSRGRSRGSATAPRPRSAS